MKEHWRRQFDRKITKAETSALEEQGFPATEDGPFADAIRFRARREVVRAHLKALDKHREEVREEYWQELRRDDDAFPTKWMRRDRGNESEGELSIMDNLKRKKNRPLIDLMNWMSRNTLDVTECRDMMAVQGIPKYTLRNKKDETHDWDLVFVQPMTEEVRTTIMETLSITKYKLYALINEMVQRNMLRAYGKAGPNEPGLLAIGFWSPVKRSGSYRRNWFIKNSPEMVQALRRFGT